MKYLKRAESELLKSEGMKPQAGCEKRTAGSALMVPPPPAPTVSGAPL